MATVRLVSSYTNAGSLGSLLYFSDCFFPMFQQDFKLCIARPPIFAFRYGAYNHSEVFGLMFCNNCFRRARSSLDLIFVIRNLVVERD